MFGGIDMTNFDFLQKEPKFHSFADVAVAAEKILPIDVAASVLAALALPATAEITDLHIRPALKS